MYLVTAPITGLEGQLKFFLKWVKDILKHLFKTFTLLKTLKTACFVAIIYAIFSAVMDSLQDK